MAHVQRAGGVGGDVFHAHRAARAAPVAAVGGALRQRGGHFALVGAGAEVEIDETRAGDLHLGHVVAGRQCGDQRGGDGARIAACGLGQLHGGVGGEVAVFAGLGALDHEIRRGGVGRQGAGGAQGVDALGDQGAEGSFHGRPSYCVGTAYSRFSRSLRGVVAVQAVRWSRPFRPSRVPPSTAAARRRRRSGPAGARRPAPVPASGAG